MDELRTLDGLGEGGRDRRAGEHSGAPATPGAESGHIPKRARRDALLAVGSVVCSVAASSLTVLLSVATPSVPGLLVAVAAAIVGAVVLTVGILSD